MKTLILNALGQTKECQNMKDVNLFMESFKGVYISNSSTEEIQDFFDGKKDKITEIYVCGYGCNNINILN